MTPSINKIKRIMPAPLWDFARHSWYGLTRAAQWPAATFHPWRQASIERLSELKDSHSGQRCFIIGNGPSLNQTDLTLLRNEQTFGMNRIYLMFNELGFTTSYYVSVNSLVIEQCLADILCLPIPCFLSWRSRYAFRDNEAGIALHPNNHTIFLHTTYSGPKFALNARGRLWEGATVTYVALQLAYFLGFETVILIGVDHNFTTQGKPNTTVVSRGDDPYHFDKGYFGKGFRWQLPDLETSEQGYHMAHEAYVKAGRQVLDATVGGKLEVFPKVDYKTLF
jgi:hypothetical protein